MAPAHPSFSFDNTKTAFASKSDKELRSDYRLFRMMNNGKFVNLSTRFTLFAFKIGLPIKGIVRNTIYDHFCGGETFSEALEVVDKLSRGNVKTILDYGVEAKATTEDFDRTVEENIRAINFCKTQKNIHAVVSKLSSLAPYGLFKRFHLPEKLKEKDRKRIPLLKERLNKICSAAEDADVQIYFDAEESWYQDSMDMLVTEMMEKYNKEKAIIFNTIQLYRHDRLAFLKQSLEKARSGKYFLGVKLVRGAYMEKENKRAREENYPSPIQPDKSSCDRDYNAALAFCLDNLQQVSFCAATHNEQSCLFLAGEMEKRNIQTNHPHIHISQLYGMSDHISFNMADAGFSVSKYVPYGPVKDVIPYLIRRAQENTAVTGQMSRELTMIKKEIKRRKQER